MTIDERIANHVCCFCESELEHFGLDDPDMWGHNPDNACSIEDARCCSSCNARIVIPVRNYTNELIKSVLHAK